MDGEASTTDARASGALEVRVKANLVELFASHAGYTSDKWEHYLPIYEAALADRVAESRPVRLLEIGVQNGGSLEIWSKFLPKDSTIVGIDIDPACAGLRLPPNVRVAVGDATDPLALERMLGDEQFDVIVDDGSHKSGDVISTFEACFRRLDWGGMYFVEDMHCSYFASHGGGLRRDGTAIEWFKTLVDALNSDHFERGDASAKLDEADLQRLRLLGSEIAAVAFLDSVVMVKKSTQKKAEPYRRIMTGGESPVADAARAIPSLPISQLRGLTLSSTAFDGFASVLLNAFASAKENVGQLRESLAQLEASARTQEARAGELEAKLETRDAELEAGKDRFRQVAEDLAAAENRARSAEARAEQARQEFESIKNSRIWRSTRPYRAVMDYLRGRIGRAGISRSRALEALLQYYQGFVPERVKEMIPSTVRMAAKRQLSAKGIVLPEYTGPSLNTAVAHAEAAARVKDWPEAIARWQAVLDGFGGHETAAGRAKLNISVARRLSDIEAYKDQIAKYVTARAMMSSRAEQPTRIAIYTAICGNYDTIKLPEKLDPRFDYVLFTDRPAPDTGVWQVRPITYFHSDPTRAARFVKTHPHMLLEDHDIAIWIDANIMILGDIYPLLEEFVSSGKAVAAIPHPLRKLVHDEAEACIRQKKDDANIIREQASYYRQSGFKHSDLIESNLMMFDLRHERTRAFLDRWWTEIDRYSKRDQLSLNYALKQVGIEWHPLTEHPNSARNHPELAFVPHDAGDGAAGKLIDALKVPAVDPMLDLVRVVQFTPSKTSNAYYTMLPAALRRIGYNVECSDQWEATRRRQGDRRVIVHLHQLEPYYHRADAEKTWEAARTLVERVKGLVARDLCFVWTWHNPYPHDRRYLEIDTWLYDQIGPLVSRVIVHLRSAIPFVQDYVDRSKIAYVPHPSFHGVYGTLRNRAESRAKLGIPVDAFVFLSLGEVKSYKGHDLLASAWKGIKREPSTGRAMLCVAGRCHEDELCRSLRELESAKLKLEYIPHSDVATWLAAADVAVYAHREIWTSGAAILAMSYGLPVILPDTAHTREYVRDEDNGFLFAPNEVSGLKSAMLQAFHSPLLEHMRFMNTAFARKHTPDAAAAQLACLYGELG